jgi:hypothetical protein
MAAGKEKVANETTGERAENLTHLDNSCLFRYTKDGNQKSFGAG